MEIAIGVWFFLLGGAVGSFLNVVVYRLPAGMSLAHPGSHCPLCNHAIRWYDNVPIFGWLALRGRCRDCRAPIAARYPLVELATAVLFVVVGWADELAGPVASWLVPGDAETSSAKALWNAATPAIAHATMLSTLLAAALIQYDGKRIPSLLRFFSPAVLMGVLPLCYGVIARSLETIVTPAHPIAGFCAGLGLSALLWRKLPREDRLTIGFSAALVGECFGWPWIAICAALAAAAYFGGRRLLELRSGVRRRSRGAHRKTVDVSRRSDAFIAVSGWGLAFFWLAAGVVGLFVWRPALQAASLHGIF
jgi:prepilin signal peptidase PulO-like enzyme (type II secretory pathway)